MWGFLSFLIDLLFPGACLICGREYRDSSGELPPVIPPRWPPQAVSFLASDFTARLPGGLRVPAGVLCPPCWLSLEPVRDSDPIARLVLGARRIPLLSPFFINDPLLTVVHFLKFFGGSPAAVPLSWWMAREITLRLGVPSSPGTADLLLVPVPLHTSRERGRGYNQAALLAEQISSRLCIDSSRCLIRRRRTRPQSKLDAGGRAENVKGAFLLARPDDVRDRDILLVDDLVTTGETVKACIEALRAGDPRSIAVLAAGRARGAGS